MPMWKAVLAGSTALVIAGSSLVYAQQRQGQPEFGRGGPNIEDMRAFGEARLAALKAGLMLTPEQERNWPAFEQAAREMAKQRLDRISAFASARRERQARSNDPIERMRQRATVMAETGAALKKYADAMDPLYKSLDDGQKRRFAILSRTGRSGGEFRGGERNPRFGAVERDSRGTDRGADRGRGERDGRPRFQRDGRQDVERDGRPGRERDGRRGFERDGQRDGRSEERSPRDGERGERL
jgi:hypothetical protein